MTAIGLLLAALQVVAGWSDWGTLPAPLGHVSLNPMTAILLISGAGGVWTFGKRFMQARNRITALDLSDPLPQNSSDVEE